MYSDMHREIYNEREGVTYIIRVISLLDLFCGCQLKSSRSQSAFEDFPALLAIESHILFAILLGLVLNLPIEQSGQSYRALEDS